MSGCRIAAACERCADAVGAGRAAGRPARGRSLPGRDRPARSIAEVSLPGGLALGAHDDPAERAAKALAARALGDAGAAPTRDDMPPRRPGRAAGVGVPDRAAMAAALAEPGAALAPAVRDRLQTGFGRNFREVRVHDGPAAARAAATLGARAWTLGSSIGFARGAYRPGTREGDRLIAHELAHVVEGGARIVRRQPAGETLDQRYERALAEARRTGSYALAAELLNGFSRPAIFARIADMDADELGRIHLAARGSPGVGPASAVAELTAPGRSRVSSMAAGPSAAPAPAPAPGGAADAPTLVPMDYRYTLVGTVPLPPEGGAPPAAGRAAGSVLSAPTVLGGTTAGLGASVPTFLDPIVPRQPIAPGAPDVYTRFVGPETAEQFLDPHRLRMLQDLRPRLYQAGDAAAREEAFALFQRGGVRYAQLSQLRSALLVRGFDGLTAEEAALLRQVAQTHARIAGATPASPLLSLTELPPEEALARLPPTATNRAYIVRVRMAPADVGRVNQLLPEASKTLSGELEVVVARDLTDAARVRILSVTRNPSPSAPLGGMVGPVLTWVGRGLMVLGAGVAAYQVATASGPDRRERQGRAFGGFAGGVALGALGAGLCVGLGVATAGLGLLACGLAFGALGAVGGSAIGSRVGRRFD